MSDLISRKALCEYALNQKDKSVTPNDIMRFPSAITTGLDKEEISELLNRIYQIQSPHLSAEGVIAKQYYCEELWKVIFHDDELPVWMHWS